MSTEPLAKSKKSAGAAGRLFERRVVEKEYRAVLHGHVDASCWVTSRIAPDTEKNRMRISAAGKEAKTQIVPISQGELDAKPYTYVRMHPLTGRRHQLRLHSLQIGYPIAGDLTYAKDAKPLRMMLHARRLYLPLESPFSPLSVENEDSFSDYFPFIRC